MTESTETSEIIKQRDEAVANWLRYVQQYEDAEAACNANIKRIAELEERLRVADKAYQALFDRCGGWPGIIAKEEHIAALEALLERVPHWWDNGQKCIPSCVRCAYEKTKAK